MQPSPPISPRAERLRDKFLATTPSVCSERSTIITQAYKDFQAFPAILKRAKTLQRILEKMSIWIADEELIIGNQARYPRSSPVFPEFSFSWVISEMINEPFEERSADRFLVRDEDKEALKGIEGFWKGKTINDFTIARLPEKSFNAIRDSAAYTFAPDVVICSGVGHYSPNYKKIIEKGFLGVKADAQKKLEELGIPDQGADVNKYNFWQAIIIVCDATIAFAKRYADLARELADKEANPTRKEELLKIAANCERVPAHPAETFYEALQSFYFFQLILQIESSGHSVSPGRFDQYMYPTYKADLDKGAITYESALELVECLWVKLSEINKVRPIGATKAFGGYPMFQNLCIGGQTRDGKDATNDLSFMCLDATGNVQLHQPSLSARLWNETPDELWHKIVKITKKGLGMPALYNDEVIIPGMLNRGKTIEDARDYAIVGCVEPGAQGFEYAWSGGTGDAPFFSMPACLEYAINDGKSLVTGVQVGPKTGSLETFKSFDEVKEAYIKQIAYFVDQFAVITNTADLVHQDACPLPFLSCGMEYCVDKGLDVSAGGSKYNATGTAGVGISNAGDSLMVLKKLLYEDRSISGKDFLEILKNNWEGQDVLRNKIKSTISFYGNDEPEADELAYFAAEVYCKLTELSVGPRGPYSPGLYPVSANIPMGLGMGASPDGRKAGEPLADGISPVHGHDKNGPTAVLKSAGRIDHFINSNGTLLNLKFHPSALEGSTGEDAIIAAIKTFFDLKGLHVQYNVISAKKLRDAQKNPEKYQNLVVRVAGYSALFVGLDPALQEDIITRTEFSEIA